MKKTQKKLVNKKRKTKRINKMKKRIKKGGDGGEIFNFKLYSEVYHKTQNNYIRRNMRPIYNFKGEKKGEGNFADVYLGTIHCSNEENCIESKPYPWITFLTQIFKKKVKMDNKLSKQLSTMVHPIQDATELNDKYILRVYGKKSNNETDITDEGLDETVQERNGVKLIHYLLTNKCNNHVSNLYDYGILLDNESGHEKGSLEQNTCIDDKCFYTIMEAGKCDCDKYFLEQLKTRSYKKYEKLNQIILYIIKMIRNVQCLHKQNIMHYDIKLANSIIKEGSDTISEGGSDVKLIDFGISEKIEKFGANRKNRSGTIGFVPWKEVNGKYGQVIEEEHLQRAYDDIYAIFAIFSYLIDELEIPINILMRELYMEKKSGKNEVRRINSDFLNEIKEREENNNKERENNNKWWRWRTYNYDESIYEDIVSKFQSIYKQFDFYPYN